MMRIATASTSAYTTYSNRNRLEKPSMTRLRKGGAIDEGHICVH